MDKDLISSRVKPIPRELFTWGVLNRSGRPRNRDPELIRIHLLPGAEATVTPRGIRFKGEFYTCDKAEEENWRFVARNKGTWKVEIAYDPRVPEIIYLRPRDGSPSIPCSLMSQDSIAIGVDFAEIEEYYERKQVEDEVAKVQDMQGRAELDADIEDIVAEAKELFNAASAEAGVESARSRISGIDEHRQAEIELMNQEYRTEILRKEGIGDATGLQPPASARGTDSDEEYVQRPRLSNVLSIQERMMRQHGKEN